VAPRIHRSVVHCLLALCIALVPFAARAADAHFNDPDHDVENVIDLLRARLDLMPEVAAWKYAHDLPVVDVARERDVLNATVVRARGLGIDPARARALFDLQILLARQIQERRIDQWREGRRMDVRQRDLATELRPELDRIGNDLLAALYLALPTFARADFTTRYAALQSRLTVPGISDDDAADLWSALGALRAESTTTGSRVAASKVLRVGLTGDYAPFSLESQGALSGVDVETAQALATALGARAVFVRTTWSTLLADYRAHQFDVAMGGISVTPERARVASFSVAYHRGGKTPIVRCGSEAQFDTLAEIDRPDVRLIVNPGGTNETFARERLSHAHLSVHPDNRTIFAELAANRADVMVTDDVEVELAIRHSKGLCRATTATFTQADKAILLPREPAFVASVDRFLSAEIAGGAIARRLDAALGR
jgi:cyclohexadienyl dehydratase